MHRVDRESRAVRLKMGVGVTKKTLWLVLNLLVESSLTIANIMTAWQCASVFVQHVGRGSV